MNVLPTHEENKHEDDRLGVLYVDDEEKARKYFALMMAPELDVQTAANIQEAMTYLRSDKHRIGVLVTDYRMPNGTGADLLRQLAQEPMEHVVPILFTAYADKAVLLETLNDGHVFRVLEKPLEVGKMRSVLRAACTQAAIRLANQRAVAAQREGFACVVHELNMPLTNITNSVLSIQYQVAREQFSQNQQTTIGLTASSINKNVRYCRSVLSTLAATVESTLITTANQLITSFMSSYPFTFEEREHIQLALNHDFSVRALPNG
ncbi:MAG: response regulator, partial [Pseudomonadota bacterium]